MKKIVYCFATIMLLACSHNDDAQYTNIPIDLAVPSNFPEMAYDMEKNPLTQQGFELGKKIFYDGRLASDGIVSCGFCHEQSSAFTHHGHTFSHGVDDQIGKRNTPPIQNMAFQSNFMWDGASDHLEMMPLIPILSEVEMNGNFISIIEMMKADADYRNRFKTVFKNGTINSENMLKALAQFMAMMISSNSRFDKYRRNETGGTFTEDEFVGYTLFQSKCASCHSTDLFTDNSLRNNGLAINPKINDYGKYEVTGREEDKFKFKVPSLRNVAYTAPYMHDGRYFTLEAAVEHYRSKVQDTQNLDPLLKQNATLGIAFTDEEKVKIIAFLKTLSDEEFINDKRFSEY